jgi:hypothetical protein
MQEKEGMQEKEEKTKEGSKEKGRENVQINPDLVLFDIPFFHSFEVPSDGIRIVYRVEEAKLEDMEGNDQIK